MTKGLHLWKNNGSHALLDPNNLFWALLPDKGKEELLIPEKTLELYNKFNNILTKEIKDFRFGQELTAIYIDPTDACNANCKYCYIPQNIKKRGMSLSSKELGQILKKIAAYSKDKGRKQVIIFHASEPLIVKDMLFKTIEKFNKTFKFGIQTNGILLEKKDVDFLIKNRVGVGISLDSVSPSIHASVRPSAAEDHGKVVRAIGWFNGYEGLNIITTITRFNVKELPDIVRFLHKKRVPCVLMNPVRLTQKASRSIKPDEKLMTKYFLKAVNTTLSLTQKTKQKIIIGNFTNAVLGIIAPEARRLMCDISPCGGGRCFFTITASGDVIPCGEFIGLKDFYSGNILNDDIEDIMASRPFKKIRSRIVENIKECDICRYRNLCGAPCPAELHSLGNMHQKAVFCEFYKSVITHAFKLIKENKIGHLLRAASLKGLEYKYDISAEK
jgi:uncharacterized protein